jgi:hypothetical protein
MIRVAALVAMTLLATTARAQDAGQPPPPPAPTAATATPPAPLPPEPAANPPPKPVFKQAWFWGVLLSSLTVVAAGIAIGVTFGR